MEETFTLTITRRQRVLLMRLLDAQRDLTSQNYQDFLLAGVSEDTALRVSGFDEIRELVMKLRG